MWPASVCGQPAWVAATQPGPRRRARTAGVTQPGGLGRPNQAGWPSPSVLPGLGSPGRPGWPAPPNQGGRAAQPVCLGHPASTHQPYGRLAGHPGPPGQPGLLSLAACRQQRLAAMAVDGSGRSARRARKGRRAREGSRPTKAIAATVAAAHAAASIARVTRSAAPSTRARPPALLHPPTRASPAVGLMTIRRAPRRVTGFRRSATLLAGLIWPRQSVAARRCRQVDARSVRDVPAGSGTGASGPVAGRRCRWLQPAPRASRAAGPPSRARPRPLGSAAAAWPAGLGRVARRRGGHLRCQDKAHAAVEAACQP